jgi:hypothetical protein
LDPRAKRLLRADALRSLPDATADPGSANIRYWQRALLIATVLGGAGLVISRFLGRK